MFYTSKIISRMQFLTSEVATQKAETRISCNTIATWSSYLERNADIDSCLETGLGLGLGLGWPATWRSGVAKQKAQQRSSDVLGNCSSNVLVTF